MTKLIFKKAHVFLGAFLCFFSIVTYAGHYDGFIVKLNEGKKNLTSNMKLEEVSYFNTSFGKFALVKGLPSIKMLKDRPEVEYIEPNWIIHVDSAPHLDSGFTMQWGLENLGWNVANGIAEEDVNIKKAWEITKGRKNVIIAVIDSGIDFNHSELHNNIWINTTEKNGLPLFDDDNNGYVDDIYGYNFVTSDTSPPLDGLSHGTHCAGIIGSAHNGIGVMGVMESVRLMPVKVFGDNGSSDIVNAVKGIEYAIQNGAKIISISWGLSEFSQTLRDIIQLAESKGVIIVASAGNSGVNNDEIPHYPSGFDFNNIISVGSFSSSGFKSSFSNYGKKSVDIFAPGEDIFSTVKGNNYALMSGTSMATPFVSGAIGLFLSLHPDLYYDDVYNRLINSSVKSNKLNDMSVGGRLDVFHLLSD